MSYDNLEYSNESGYPAELFLFMNGSIPMAYTSADEPITYNFNTYKATEYIECDGIENIAEGSGRNDTKIKVSRNFEVAKLFQTTPPPNPIWLTIFRYHRGDGEFRRYWGGRVRSVIFNGEEAEISVDSEGAALERNGLWKTYQPICNHILYSLECSINETANRTLITVSSISGNNVQAAGGAISALGDGHTALGEARRLTTGEKRMITAHVGNAITLLQPFEDLQLNEQLYIFAGCDGRKSTCSSGKFKDGGGSPVDNKDNHGGFDKIPAKNPVQVGLI